MSRKSDFSQIVATSADTNSGQVLQAALASLWRRKLIVLGIAGAALVLGIIAIFVMPTRYTAEAHIRGEFLASDSATKDDKSPSIGSINLDLGRVIETQSRLLQSHQIALRVVQQIGLERLQPVLSKPRWLSAVFKGSAAKALRDPEDIAATTLLYGLSVKSDPRAYLLTVLYRARDPELAVLITNVFVAELLRSARLQKLSQQRAFAEDTLSQRLAKFGDKHPRLIEVRMRLAATDDLLKEQLSDAPEAILQAAGENVTKAKSYPSSPKPAFVIGLLLLVGLLVGVGVGLWLERGRWWPAFSPY